MHGTGHPRSSYILASAVLAHSSVETLTMSIEHHSLLHELPQLRERIHELKTGNPKFADLYRQYDETDKEIYRIEEEIETPSDKYTEDLKKRRVLLKDQLYAMLQGK